MASAKNQQGAIRGQMMMVKKKAQRFYYASVAALLYVWIGAGSANPGMAFPDQYFTVGLGQTVYLKQDKIAIKFKAVLEDSRCPINVLCVWAGNAKIELEVFDSDGQKKSIILNTEDEPFSATLTGHNLTLISLNPPRMDGVTILPKDYAVNIRVKKIVRP